MTIKINSSGASNSDIMAVYIAINGVVEYNSKATAFTDDEEDASITVIWQYEFNPDDYVEVYIANDSDTTDILVSGAVLRVN